MLTDIGLMVGLYAAVRLLSLILRRGERAEPPIVQWLFAPVALIAVIFLMADLIKNSTDYLKQQQEVQKTFQPAP